MLARWSPASRRAARGAPQAGFDLDTGSAPRHSAAIGGPGKPRSVAPLTEGELRALGSPDMQRGRVVSRPPAASLGRSSDVPALLTPHEVAVALRTSRKAIYAMIEREQLPGIVRIGRRLLIRQDALLDFLDHNCASSPRENRR